MEGPRIWGSGPNSELRPSRPCTRWLALLPMWALSEAGLCHNTAPQTLAPGNPVCSKLSFVCQDAQGPLSQGGETCPCVDLVSEQSWCWPPRSPPLAGLGWCVTQTLGAACSPSKTSRTVVAGRHLPRYNRGSGSGAHTSTCVHMHAHPRSACVHPAPQWTSKALDTDGTRDIRLALVRLWGGSRAQRGSGLRQQKPLLRVRPSGPGTGTPGTEGSGLQLPVSPRPASRPRGSEVRLASPASCPLHMGVGPLLHPPPTEAGRPFLLLGVGFASLRSAHPRGQLSLRSR